MQNQSSTKNSHCVIGDYQGSSNCGVLFASSIRKFKVKVWFNLVNGKQKGQAKSNYIYGIVIVLVDVADLGHPHIRVLSGKLCQTKYFMNSTLSIACWQNGKNITACKMQFQRKTASTFVYQARPVEVELFSHVSFCVFFFQ